MTILIIDAQSQLYDYGDIFSKKIHIHELLYADDTLLIDDSDSCLQKYMDIIRDLGREYGLELNWKKVEYLSVRCQASFSASDGSEIHKKTAIEYLGALIDENGMIDSELARRIGLAAADFKALRKVWNHLMLSKIDKYRTFMNYVVSKLLYGL